MTFTLELDIDMVYSYFKRINNFAYSSHHPTFTESAQVQVLGG